VALVLRHAPYEFENWGMMGKNILDGDLCDRREVTHDVSRAALFKD
jgi:hypothetical protein